jgi:hypothetical protein
MVSWKYSRRENERTLPDPYVFKGRALCTVSWKYSRGEVSNIPYERKNSFKCNLIIFREKCKISHCGLSYLQFTPCGIKTNS